MPKYTYQELADAAQVSKSTIENDRRKRRYDPKSFASVLTYILKRRAERAPAPKPEEPRPRFEFEWESTSGSGAVGAGD